MTRQLRVSLAAACPAAAACGAPDEGGYYHSVYRDPTNEYGGAL